MHWTLKQQSDVLYCIYFSSQGLIPDFLFSNPFAYGFRIGNIFQFQVLRHCGSLCEVDFLGSSYKEKMWRITPGWYRFRVVSFTRKGFIEWLSLYQKTWSHKKNRSIPRCRNRSRSRLGLESLKSLSRSGPAMSPHSGIRSCKKEGH